MMADQLFTKSRAPFRLSPSSSKALQLISRIFCLNLGLILAISLGSYALSAEERRNQQALTTGECELNLTADVNLDVKLQELLKSNYFSDARISHLGLSQSQINFNRFQSQLHDRSTVLSINPATNRPQFILSLLDGRAAESFAPVYFGLDEFMGSGESFCVDLQQKIIAARGDREAFQSLVHRALPETFQSTSSKMPLGEALIRLEFTHWKKSAETPKLAQQKLEKAMSTYQALLTEFEPQFKLVSSLDHLSTLWPRLLKKIYAEEFLNTRYCNDQASLIEIFNRTCMNCVAETSLFMALFTDLQIAIPEGFALGAEIFHGTREVPAGHISPVLYNQELNQVIDLSRGWQIREFRSAFLSSSDYLVTFFRQNSHWLHPIERQLIETHNIEQTLAKSELYCQSLKQDSGPELTQQANNLAGLIMCDSFPNASAASEASNEHRWRSLPEKTSIDTQSKRGLLDRLSDAMNRTLERISFNSLFRTDAQNLLAELAVFKNFEINGNLNALDIARIKRVENNELTLNEAFSSASNFEFIFDQLSSKSEQDSVLRSFILDSKIKGDSRCAILRPMQALKIHHTVIETFPPTVIENQTKILFDDGSLYLSDENEVKAINRLDLSQRLPYISDLLHRGVFEILVKLDRKLAVLGDVSWADLLMAEDEEAFHLLSSLAAYYKAFEMIINYQFEFCDPGDPSDFPGLGYVRNLKWNSPSGEHEMLSTQYSGKVGQLVSRIINGSGFLRKSLFNSRIFNLVFNSTENPEQFLSGLYLKIDTSNEQNTLKQRLYSRLQMLETTLGELRSSYVLHEWAISLRDFVFHHPDFYFVPSEPATVAVKLNEHTQNDVSEVINSLSIQYRLDNIKLPQVDFECDPAAGRFQQNGIFEAECLSQNEQQTRLIQADSGSIRDPRIQIELDTIVWDSLLHDIFNGPLRQLFDFDTKMALVYAYRPSVEEAFQPLLAGSFFQFSPLYIRMPQDFVRLSLSPSLDRESPRHPRRFFGSSSNLETGACSPDLAAKIDQYIQGFSLSLDAQGVPEEFAGSAFERARYLRFLDLLREESPPFTQLSLPASSYSIDRIFQLASKSDHLLPEERAKLDLLKKLRWRTSSKAESPDETIYYFLNDQWLRKNVANQILNSNFLIYVPTNCRDSL